MCEKSAENLTKQPQKIPAVTQPSCTSNGEVLLARVRSSLDGEKNNQDFKRKNSSPKYRYSATAATGAQNKKSTDQKQE
jgi:hypothetical protein